MIFANGDCFVTYVTEHKMTHEAMNQLNSAFEDYDKTHLQSVTVTQHSASFRYRPLQVMNRLNTIEPEHAVVEEALEFLRKVGVNE